jgi:tetratricopeptide (TPR) repeat protein
MEVFMYRPIRCLNLSVLVFVLFTFLLGPSLFVAFAQNKEADSVFAVGQTHLKKGMDLLKGGEKSKALREFSKAADCFADHQDYLRSKLDSIKPKYESFLAKDPQSPLFTYLMGRWYAAAQRDSVGQMKAIAFYEAALKLEPKFAWPYHGLAALSTRKSDYEGAAKYYLKAIDADPDFDIGYIYLASTYERLGKESEALKVRRKLLVRDSTSYGATFAMLDLARNSKNPLEKEELYQKVIRLTEIAWLREDGYRELLWARLSERPDSAVSLARRLLTAGATTDRYTRQTAQLMIFYAMKKTNPGDIPAYAKTLLGEPDPMLLGQIGAFCLDSLHNVEVALQCLRNAYKVCTKDNVDGTVIHGSAIPVERLIQVADETRQGFIAIKLGEAYFELKDYNNAEKFLREAVSFALKKSYPASALYELAYTLEAKGNKEEAITWLTRGLVIKHDDKAMATLEKLLTELGGKQSAEEKINAERHKSAKPAPDFALATLKGESIQLSKLQGKVVMIDFWATWCGPCVSELPNLAKLYDKYSKNPKVVFLSIDTNEPATAIKPFMEKNSYSFTVLLGNQTSVPQQYGVDGIPTKFLIDRNGKIQFKHVGGGPEPKVIDDLRREIDELLGTDVN